MLRATSLVTQALLVSLGVTVVGTAFSMVVIDPVRLRAVAAGSFGHRTILMLLIVTMFFSGGLIPTFLRGRGRSAATASTGR